MTMPAFTAIVLDDTGRRALRREEAADERQLRARLRARGVWPLEVRAAPPDRGLARLTLPLGEFIPWLNQFELQLRAGVMPDVALRELAHDAPPGPLQRMLGHIQREVAQGRPIHEACRTLARQFPPHIAAVIAAGEASATLPDALRDLADHLAGAEEMRRTARRALIYPAVVLAATAGLVAFLLGVVVPKFTDIFVSLQMTLPLPTRLLIGASDWVRAGWPVLLGGAALFVLLACGAKRSARLRHARDGIALRVPVLGETLRCLATARFAAHCRLLHHAGIPLLDALKTAAQLVRNAVLAGQLERAREGLALGRPLHASLPKNHDFPRFIVPALKSGESTGQLGTALRHIEAYAARRARERLDTALALLEPLILALLTAVVGAIALSFFLPLFSLLGGLNAR